MEYLDSDNYEQKLKVIEERREKAKLLFQQQKYEEALKEYIFLININSHLSKKIYNSEQMDNLTEKLNASKRNYVRCAIKFKTTIE